MVSLALLLLIAAATATQAESLVPYQEGQVWEYRTRPEDVGSLLRIQKIEENPDFAKYGPIYHVSVIGVQSKMRL